jgi:hypothetical protein
MSTASDGVFTAEEQCSHLRHTGMLSRKHEDMASAFQSDVRGLLREPMRLFLFFGGQWAHIRFAWSTPAHFLLWLCYSVLHVTSFPAGVSPLYQDGKEASAQEDRRWQPTSL